eukprot:CAMPEP_0201566638 /NCGR_PEP_ID=MMETSP0190_2-20130828/6572_1 /ASSEMBLY_ACC=CAM_ASM_000263 /TAXON_ID=37353 /ORGANISM="Rosalina sp." /LENGTH=466 /DNA_ID=CAMNT_0047985633 /DNA_START=23 /DNA_END=1420 /DNA_ORIENTATION=+
MSVQTTNRKRADSSNTLNLHLYHAPINEQKSENYSIINHNHNNHNADVLTDAPPALHHAASDPINYSHGSSNNSSSAHTHSSTYEVRPCRVEDTDSIDTIMRKAWPDEPEWRNPQYWTKEFIKPASERYGYVIESYTNTNMNTQSILPSTSTIMGFAMYKWSKPISQKPFWQNQYGYKWYIDDFNVDIDKDIYGKSVSYKWKKGFNQRQTSTNGYNNLLYNNKNIKENWNKLSTHIVHVTDVAIHPYFRGKGLGTQLMQSMIYSFPSGTRFGLEVKCDNHGGVKCYQKCGFVIKRRMPHYYGRKIDGYKMVLISNYTPDDISNFVKTTQLKKAEKERQNVRKQLENFHINNVKSKALNGNGNGSKQPMNQDQDHKSNFYTDDEEDDGPFLFDDDEDMKENEYSNRNENKMEKIENALRSLCGVDWKFYFKRFEDEEVYDDDLFDLNEKDLAKLLPKIGPRSRVRNW